MSNGYQPIQGEKVWIKVFSNWSSGTYIGYDIIKYKHLVREDLEGGGNLFESKEVLPYDSMPNKPKQETLEEAAEVYAEIYRCPTTNTDEYCKHDIISAINFGAKWQQERSYSEEEVKSVIEKTLEQCNKMMQESYGLLEIDVDYIFEQFKKEDKQ
jgi:hypothetical protein